MEKLKTILNQYFWLVVLAWLIIIAAFVYWIAGTYEERKTESSIKATQTQANTSLNAANNFQKQAAAIEVNRKIEDGLREKILQPELTRRRQNSNSSKTNLDHARTKYNEKIILHNSNLSDDCSKLQRLFPGQTFEYCQ